MHTTSLLPFSSALSVAEPFSGQTPLRPTSASPPDQLFQLLQFSGPDVLFFQKVHHQFGSRAAKETTQQITYREASDLFSAQSCSEKESSDLGSVVTQFL